MGLFDVDLECVLKQHELVCKLICSGKLVSISGPFGQVCTPFRQECGPWWGCWWLFFDGTPYDSIHMHR